MNPGSGTSPGGEGFSLGRLRIAWFGVLVLVALGVLMGLAWAEVPTAHDPAAAIPALEAAWTHQAQVAPAFGLLLAEARLGVGDHAGALVAARSVLAAQPPWAPRAAWVALQALPPDRCAEVDALAGVAEKGADVPTAALLARQASLLAACGRADAARALRRTLVIGHADTAEGRAVVAEPALTIDERFEQASRLEQARAHAEAAAALDALVGLPGPHQDRARFERARLEVDRLRVDFKGAAAVFAELARSKGPLAEPAAWQHARALGRAGDLAGAEAAWRTYRSVHPQGSHVDESRFFEVFSIYEANRFADAAAAFAGLLAPGGLAADSSWRDSAAWYHALCLHLAGAPEAAARFDALAGTARPGTTDARRAAYWAARARVAEEPLAAAVALVRLVNADSGDWYALLVQAEFPHIFPDLGALAPEPAAPTSAELLAAWPAADAEGRGRISQVLAYADARLPSFARAAFLPVERALRSADREPLLRAVAERIGAHDRALKSAMRSDFRRAVAVPEVGAEPADAALWRAAWPAGFDTEARAAAARHGIPAAWIWAFIRKESAFDASAVSRAHAVGLMQLLPRTAAALVALPGFDAAHVRRADGAPDLFDPATNIELGAAYLAALSARFGGQLPLVAAAYNAGPSAVTGWLAPSGTVRLDQFVETIPYRETREYVKRLVEGWVRVERLHLGHSLQESLRGVPVRLDVSVRPGVDF